jgi:hypothetical protein
LTLLLLSILFIAYRLTLYIGSGPLCSWHHCSDNTTHFYKLGVLRVQLCDFMMIHIRYSTSTTVSRVLLSLVGVYGSSGDNQIRISARRNNTKKFQTAEYLAGYIPRMQIVTMTTKTNLTSTKAKREQRGKLQ